MENKSSMSLEDKVTLDRLGRYLEASEKLSKSSEAKRYLDAGGNCLRQAMKDGLKRTLIGLESAMEDMEAYVKLTEAFLASGVVRKYLEAAEAFIESDEWEDRGKLALQYCLDFSEELFENYLDLYGNLKTDLGIGKLKQSLNEVRVFMDSEELETLKRMLAEDSIGEPELTLEQLITWVERVSEWETRVGEIWQLVSEFMNLFSGG